MIRTVLVVNASEEQGGTLILNRAGEIVWYRDRPAGRVTSHAERTRDRRCFSFHQDADRLDASLSEMERVDWMGACRKSFVAGAAIIASSRMTMGLLVVGCGH